MLHGKAGVDSKRYLLMRDEKLGKLKLNTLVVKGMQFSRAGKAGINFSTQLMEAPTDPETGKVDAKRARAYAQTHPTTARPFGNPTQRGARNKTQGAAT